MQTRLPNAEARLLHQKRMSTLHARKTDKLEQVCRLKGIEVIQNDSPLILMEKIKSEIQILGLDIPDGQLDRSHRDEKIYTSAAWSSNNYQTKRVQDVLVRYCTKRSRNLMLQKRKEFSFTVDGDLTFSNFCEVK